ncbi:MAG: hypothetical protein ACREHV_00975 [Rhizomicrobium sp.]
MVTATNQTPTGPSRRTQAERDVINARCASYPRPLSGRQIEALKALARACSGPARHFVHSVAGYHAPGESVHAFTSQTMESLRRRGFAKRLPWKRAFIITAAGRREAARH